MNIKPVASPADVKQPAPTDNRAKAIAAFNRAAQTQTQEHPVQNPSQVSVEELSAIQTQTEPQSTENTDKSADIVDTEVKQTEEPKKEDPALSRQFAQLARQERALRAKAQQQDQAYKAREEALKAKEAELAAKAQEYESGYIPKSRIKQDSLGVLAEAGVSYDDITQQLIGQTPVDPRIQATIDSLKAEIQELKKGSEQTQKTYQEQQQSAYQAAVKQIEMDAKALIKGDPVNYEAIVKTGTVKQVVKLITDTFNKDGVLLTVEEAAQEVENYLVEENYKMASNIDKIKKRMAQTNASSAKPEEKTQAPKQTQPQMKTLTNAAASTRKLSAKERAILAFKGELKP